MTVREFINAVTQNPIFLDMELSVVDRTVKENNGPFDGGVWVHFKPVQSVTIGGNELVFWVNPNSEKKQLFVADLSKWPAMTVIGPTPDSLKW